MGKDCDVCNVLKKNCKNVLGFPIFARARYYVKNLTTFDQLVYNLCLISFKKQYKTYYNYYLISIYMLKTD